MTRFGWWLPGFLAHGLQPAERAVVLGDIAESGEGIVAATRDVVGLIVRRQALLWTFWRPWLALLGVSWPGRGAVEPHRIPLQRRPWTTTDGIPQIRSALRDWLECRSGPGVFAMPCGGIDGLVMDVRVRAGFAFRPRCVAHVAGVLPRSSEFGMGTIRTGRQYHPARPTTFAALDGHHTSAQHRRPSVPVPCFLGSVCGRAAAGADAAPRMSAGLRDRHPHDSHGMDERLV